MNLYFPIIYNNYYNNMSSAKFDNLLRVCSVKKGDKTERTNLRIGDKTSNILGGSFHIPDDNYNNFLQQYCTDIVKKGKIEYLTEKQLENGGPYAIDLDFRYDYEVRTRLHNDDHVDEFVVGMLDVLKSMYQMDDTTCFNIYVMQKDCVNPVKEKNLTKDGIHILIGLKADKTTSLYLRNQMLGKMEGIFEKLPLTNSYEDVYDKGVASGSNQWQLYGSQKPNHLPYKIYKIYEITYDQDDQEFMMDELDKQTFDVCENIEKLSVRNTKNPQLFIKSDFAGKYEEFKNAINGKVNRVSTPQSGGISSKKVFGNEQELFKQISSPEELGLLVDSFLENIGEENYELKEYHSYVMALSPSYYGNGSYNNWIRVCWALNNTHERMLLTWIAFSAKAPNFCYSSVSELIERWNSCENNLEGLTKKSIVYWIKEDNPTAYNEIHKQNISFIINQIVYGVGGASNFINDNDVSDDVFGQILYQLYKGEYICASIEKNTWFKYLNNRWQKDDSGISLRAKIQRIKILLHEKLQEFNTVIVNTSTDENENSGIDKVKKVQRRLLKIIQKIGNASVKKNILTEAKELFYDANFIEYLDSKPYLIAFNNGVVDFEKKEFRKGRPEDYISLSTNINYIKLNDTHKDIVTEIRKFFRQIYPQPELYEYMWEHLASCMTGWNKMQTCQMYIGDGQNGKSAVIQLMALVLGNYKYEVTPAIITNDRVKVGQTSPEMLGMKGKRMVCIQETKKTDTLNEAIFKQITSANDPVTARGLYAEQVSFIPQFKLVIASNYLMNIEATDHGTWRRVRVAPHVSLFTDNPVQGDREKPYQFKKDMDIGEKKFPIWKEIMASMLIDIAYDTQGVVKDCDIVTSKSREYMESQDSIAEFLRDKVAQRDGAHITKQDISSEYSIWYQQTYGRGGPTSKDLYEYMNKRFGRAKNSTWRNIELVRGNRRANVDSDDEGSGSEDDSDSVTEEVGANEI